ncbi:MAG: hypothetical protein JWO92_1187 [Chitinophagaceae bacterium]|nr:hypothetical protein [Chitinophagaceae bacterium]
MSVKLFRLVKTLSSGEKRHFHFFASRSSDNDLKNIFLFINTLTFEMYCADIKTKHAVQHYFTMIDSRREE